MTSPLSKMSRSALGRIFPTIIRSSAKYAGRLVGTIPCKKSLPMLSARLSTESITQKMSALNLNSSSTSGAESSPKKPNFHAAVKIAAALVSGVGLTAVLFPHSKKDEKTILVNKIVQAMNYYNYDNFNFLFPRTVPSKQIEEDIRALDALAKKEGKRPIDYFNFSNKVILQEFLHRVGEERSSNYFKLLFVGSVGLEQTQEEQDKAISS